MPLIAGFGPDGPIYIVPAAAPGVRLIAGITPEGGPRYLTEEEAARSRVTLVHSGDAKADAGSTVALGGGSSTTVDAQGKIVARVAKLGAVDLGGDVTMPGSVGTQQVVIGTWNHAVNQPGYLPAGEGYVAEEQGWLVLHGRLFLSTIAGRETFLTIKELGPKAEYSWGYNVLESAPSIRNGQRVRELRKILIFEVSIVLRGMNVGTGTIALSGVDPRAIEIAAAVRANDDGLARLRGFRREAAGAGGRK